MKALILVALIAGCSSSPHRRFALAPHGKIAEKLMQENTEKMVLASHWHLGGLKGPTLCEFFGKCAWYVCDEKNKCAKAGKEHRVEINKTALKIKDFWDKNLIRRTQ